MIYSGEAIIAAKAVSSNILNCWLEARKTRAELMVSRENICWLESF